MYRNQTPKEIIMMLPALTTAKVCVVGGSGRLILLISECLLIVEAGSGGWDDCFLAGRAAPAHCALSGFGLELALRGSVWGLARTK